jgi:hypothetical protein
LEIGQFFNTRLAPGCPKVEDNRLVRCFYNLFQISQLPFWNILRQAFHTHYNESEKKKDFR